MRQLITEIQAYNINKFILNKVIWFTHVNMRLVLQVVDIVSTWRSLGPQLSCDSRPLMVKAIAELLALVPQLTVTSEEYEVSDLS